MSAVYPQLVREERYGYLNVVSNAMLRDLGDELAIQMTDDGARRWCARNFLRLVSEPSVESARAGSFEERDQTAFRATFRAQGLPPEERTPKSRRKVHPIWWVKRQMRRVVGR